MSRSITDKQQAAGNVLARDANLAPQEKWQVGEGFPSPLGVSWIEEEAAYNFALYSESATRVTLLLYSELDLSLPTYEYAFDPLSNKTGRVWHCRLKANRL